MSKANTYPAVGIIPQNTSSVKGHQAESNDVPQAGLFSERDPAACGGVLLRNAQYAGFRHNVASTPFDWWRLAKPGLEVS
jgi:hypothetical protein